MQTEEEYHTAEAIRIAENEAHANAMVAAYRALPVIIDKPGDYVTRSGQRVTIHPFADDKISLGGSLWKEFRGKMAPKDYLLWGRNGRRNFLGKKSNDIIGPWTPEMAPAPAGKAKAPAP